MIAGLKEAKAEALRELIEKLEFEGGEFTPIGRLEAHLIN